MAMPAEQSPGDAARPEQHEMPFAIVEGAPITELPRDLYIPPQALEVFLEAFEGPLDLLLYLIKKQNLDILNIPIAQITHQYMEYVDVMKEIRLDLAGEYLVMAAMLAEIKSRMLLPRLSTEEEEEGDPRAELVRRLQEYERYKQATDDLDSLPQFGRDVLKASADAPFIQIKLPEPRVSLNDLLHAFHAVLERSKMYAHHNITLEPLSVRERMADIITRLKSESFTDFGALFTPDEGRLGVVVTLLALLELLRESLIELVQTQPYGSIHVRTHGHDS